MKCVTCGNDNGKYDTKIGILCDECYDKVLYQVETDAKTNEEIICSNCNRTITIGDYCALDKDGNTFCVKCFKQPIEISEKTSINNNNDKSEAEAENVNSPSYTVSTVTFVAGWIIMIVAFIAGFEIFSNNISVAFAYIFAGIISGISFVGLSKIIKAAEFYLWKNKQ